MQFIHHHLFRFRTNIAFTVNPFQQIIRTNVGGHDQDRVLEIHSPSLGVRDPAVVQHLKEYIEDIRMGFLHLIKKHNTIRFPADCFRQLATLIIAHISWRSTDEPRHTVLFHVLTHVDSNHI